MSNSETPNVKKYRLGSAYDAITPVCVELHTLLVEKRFAGEWFKVELLLREAFINAAQHGNNLDPAKTVECEISIDREIITIRMKDEGPGFDWQTALQAEPVEMMNNTVSDSGTSLLIMGADGKPVPDIFDIEAVSESGRGFSIFHLYSDGFMFNDSGREVVISRKLVASAGDRDSAARDADDRTYVEITLGNGQLLVKLHGNLTADHTQEAMPSLTDRVLNESPQNLFIDMSGAGMVDSKGIGSLIALRKACMGKKCDMQLVNVPEHLMNIFQSVNLHRVLEIKGATVC
jgi:serine/threonine-protein kinase RsbW